MREHDKEFRVVKMVEVLQVSKSGDYKWRKRQGKVNPEDMSLRDLIIMIYRENQGCYGYRRIWKEITRRGLMVNHKRVLRIMQSINLKAKAPKRRKTTTNSFHRLPIAENLLNQNFNQPKEKQTCPPRRI